MKAQPSAGLHADMEEIMAEIVVLGAGLGGVLAAYGSRSGLAAATGSR